MKYPRGSSIAIGLSIGAIIGVLMENIISFIALGLMFGIIGESMARKNSDKGKGRD